MIIKYCLLYTALFTIIHVNYCYHLLGCLYSKNVSKTRPEGVIALICVEIDADKTSLIMTAKMHIIRVTPKIVAKLSECYID